MPEAVFRCDASIRIGAGHLVRCLTLADALNEIGWQCTIAGTPETGLLAAPLNSGKHAFVALSDDREREWTLRQWHAMERDRDGVRARGAWLVLDWTWEEGGTEQLWLDESHWTE